MEPIVAINDTIIIELATCTCYSTASNARFDVPCIQVHQLRYRPCIFVLENFLNVIVSTKIILLLNPDRLFFRISKVVIK